VKHAGENNIRVLPAGGGCAGFVVLNDETVYLDLEKFKDVEVDTARGIVTVGGGVRWLEVVSKILEKGYYTGTFPLPKDSTNLVSESPNAVLTYAHSMDSLQLSGCCRLLAWRRP
jgi:FAD/FMN-containing dehydrogenase